MSTFYTRKGEPFQVDDEDDYLVGRHTWRLDPRGYVIRDIRVAGQMKRLFLHKLVLPVEAHGDHIDRVKVNCRRSNLRPATTSQNAHNMSKMKHNTSGYKGVTWDKARSKWAAKIACKGVHYNLGRFSSREEAHAAYRQAAHRLHGEFARTE